MQLTIFGIIIAIVGLILLSRGGVMPMLLLMMACSLLGGSAAIILTSMGGSSIPPVHFALLFAVARIILPGSGKLAAMGRAIRANMYLGLYSLYGICAAIFGPRFFRESMGVAPMRGTAPTRSIFATEPLVPTVQNVTVTVYMIGSFMAGLVAYVAMQEKGSPRRFVKMGVIVAWTHVTLGVLAAALKGTPFDLFVDFMRNATYAQTDQSIGGIVRITGIFTEPSAYVGFGFGWFVFMLECWFRDILPRRTGAAAAAMGLVLFFSTSSTAYVALSIYSIVILARYLLLPQHLGVRKGLTIAAMLLLLAIILVTASIAIPAVVQSMRALLYHLTVEKQASDSGLQRAFWAKLGIDAFFVSHGLGVGPGSFRSSSSITAMLGSVGIVGAVLMICHTLRAFKPLRLSTYCGLREGWRFGEDAMIGAAAAWAAIGTVIVGAIASPTCDLGTDFAMFTAIALALRTAGAGSIAGSHSQLAHDDLDGGVRGGRFRPML